MATGPPDTRPSWRSRWGRSTITCTRRGIRWNGACTRRSASSSRPGTNHVSLPSRRSASSGRPTRPGLTSSATPYPAVACRTGPSRTPRPRGRRLLRQHHLEGTRLPVVLAMDGTVLVDPSHEDLMAILGLPSALGTRACDVAIIGAGPAGLAAAVYAASEGLGTVIPEPDLPGGQAGTSSLIRNYLGFPRGLSGEDLASRAVDQA